MAIEKLTAGNIRAATFTADWIAGQLSEHTARAYISDVKQFVTWYGSPDISTVKREDILRFRGWLVEQFKPATVNRKLSAVRQLMSEAVLRGVIGTNPTDSIKGHRMEGQYSSTKAPTVAQVRALLSAVEGDSLIAVRDCALISMLCRLGLRRDEAARLTIGSIGENQGHIVINIRGKGNKERQLKLIGPALAAVRRLVGAIGGGPETPLFQEVKRNGSIYYMTGQALTGNGIYYIVTRRMAAAGIEGCSPHSLRHFFITECRRNGCDLHKAQRAAGHADPRTTERYDRSWQDLDDSATDYINV